MRNPDLGQPEEIWDQIPEAMQLQLQDHVEVSTALGYEIVVGWKNAAAVVGISVPALKRAVRKGRLPKHRSTERGTRGCSACWPLSMLWKYRQWRERPHPEATR